MELKLLRVNLSKETIKEEKVDAATTKKFVGGRGIGVKILFDELKPGIDPLSPENKLIFMTGPATGTAFPACGRFHVITKSPLTGGIGDSNCGGDWGPELRFAGFDGIIFEGKAESPVYLWIHDGEAELRCAEKYWGKGIWDTEDGIREELSNPKVKFAGIGPAGENLVLNAAIINDKHRAAGRTSVGAVMGSKNLKTVAVYGTGKPQVADPEGLQAAVKKAQEKLKKSAITNESLPTYGTAVLVNIINESGIYPTRNFQTGVFPTASKTSGEVIKETVLVRKKACWGCPIACGRVSRVKNPPYQTDGEGPEYETTWSLGAMCGIDNLEAITKAHNICDELGIDPISFGSTVACAMELYEKGLIPKEKLGGLELKFGNPQAIVELAWRTAYRAGFGDEIALGAKRLAEKYGAPELAMHVKGLELPAYDPRGVKGHGLGYATSNRGGCHLRAYMIAPEIVGVPEKLDPLKTEGKAQWVKTFQDIFSICDSLVVCKFLTFALSADDLKDLTNPITGWNWTTDDLLKTGDRIYTLERMFINREGFDRKDDTLPPRLLKEPMPEGPVKGHVADLEKMLDEYYKVRGWKDGKPTKEKLKELGLA
ncbi:MAG: aldehyde ferredoxin oxidoreductase family protein [Candidatus Bathyarchaeia archaeon]|nr:aldehyde ferredoxin oxidoreductase family protein [Candidatus Bathyarchaeia archaeon]